VEMQQKRIEVKREYNGLEYEGMRGVNAIAADVDQAVSRLREVERRARDFHTGVDEQPNGAVREKKTVPTSKPWESLNALFNQGTLIHRSEPELKTHTSYLVFAVLPQDWTEEDETLARSRWKGTMPIQSNALKSQRQIKREAKQKASKKWQEDGQAEEKIESTKADVTSSE